MITKEDLIKLEEYHWEIPETYQRGMKVPACVYASEKLLGDIFGDKSLEQLVNIACLPGIQKYALAMPDAHQGYGFPIGGVAAFDLDTGIITPGGIGYDINCGVRLLKSQVIIDEIKDKIRDLSSAIYHEVPSGVGKKGRMHLSVDEIDSILKHGAKKMVQMGHGTEFDLENTESNGVFDNALSETVSSLAKKRGSDQLGTLGGGNHFVDVMFVDKIFDDKIATGFGLFKNQVTILIHTGSRGLGHQVATDYIKLMTSTMQKYSIEIPDRELACAPFDSAEGQEYLSAMAGAANFAWANRQLITSEIRQAWENVFGQDSGQLELVYDVAHNIAKIEEHQIDSKPKQVIVHRKGATRAFPDQPVLIPGTLATYSYVLVGQKESMDQTFGSTCHGAGRRMSRTKARKQIHGRELMYKLEAQGIIIDSHSYSSLAEEAPGAYKDVDEVVDVVCQAGIAKKVAALKPVAVVKC
ncbi:MAG: RtcB family protein [Patescibacteria group bacterium]|nr:RtcB family protein [Patescibacteria group bacterium]